AAVCDGDLLDDGEPEAASAAYLGAIVVEAHEPVPDAFPVRLRYAGAVVGDRDARPPRRNGHAQPHLTAGIPQGVVDEVADHPAELDLVAEHDGPHQRAGAQAHAVGQAAPGAVGYHADKVYRFHLLLRPP